MTLADDNGSITLEEALEAGAQAEAELKLAKAFLWETLHRNGGSIRITTKRAGELQAAENVLNIKRERDGSIHLKVSDK